ncbi:hypothetical protein [Microvirga sp. Mcv34]|uniref:hypothetical protein n=1 Tax=Microvirga sp. Mcv34 TaxID=2926016 RepID=UPI0021C977DD|nr:hypothetical protein [Microvirga sp. Mcv34]
METMLRLQCDILLGGRIERETPTGLVTIATVVRETDGLVVHVIDGQKATGLEHLQGLQARDCDDPQRRMSRPDVTVTMPTG